ncbi:MAG: TonB family protein [Candidatus Zixiibacteriota bacterium]
MKKEIIISLILHLGFLSAFLLFGYPTSRVEGYPRVYQVGLVSLPRAEGGGKASGSKATVTKKTSPKKAEEGISVKEVKKVQKPGKIEKTIKKEDEKAGNEDKEIKKEEKPDIGQTGEGIGEGDYGTGDVIGEGVGFADVEGAGFGSNYYVDVMRTKIAEYWRNPIRGATSVIRSTIYFKIKKDGKIADAFIEKPSGLNLFDQAALRSVLSAGPLPPLPSEYTGKELGVHLEFEFIPGR